jgi:uncharacterized delta-60 repeat protein
MKYIGLFLMILLVTNIFSQTDGSFDNNFHSDGKVITSFGTNEDEDGYGVCIQSDGKIVVGGYTDNDQGQILIARYNSNGSLDNTFGTNGLVNVLRPDLTGTSLYSIYITDVGIKSDGKIVLCGHGYKSGATYEDFYVFQFTSSGALDVVGFGTNGYTVTDVSGRTDYANALAIQSDDKIVVTGYGDGNFVTVRYTADGTLDTDFATSGVHTGPAGRGHSLTITDSGIIFVGGESGHDFGILKLDADGDIDNLFATGGILVINLGLGSDKCYALDNDGTYVFAGGGAMNGWGIAKFAITNGVLDNTFDSDGIFTTKLSNGETTDYIYGIKCQSNGDIIAGGTVSRKYDNSFNTVMDFASIRLNSNGTFDTDFSSDGKIQFNFNQYYGGNYIYSSYCRGLEQDQLGNIVLAGGGVPSTSHRDFCVARIINNTSPLPVELTLFTASSTTEGNILLQWETATEVNNYGFEVQRSEVGGQNSDWMKVGFVLGHGNTNSPKEYEFIDENPPVGNLKYRLKQIDTDGQYKYYNTIVDINNSLTSIQNDLAPSEYGLMQNYPNPFNPSTVIQFSLPEKCTITLEIINLQGERVAVIIDNKVYASGNHQVEFDASQLSSGIYFYQIKTKDFRAIKKMILLK